jgi:predicted  nucleic acid-binding Zn-ribbon protein
VQDHDTAITQLEHRRAALAEKVGLRDVEAQLARIEAARAEALGRRAALAATQKDLEAQIAVLTERRSGIEQRMYASTSSSSRDLQAMSDEVTHLTERRAELEELELVAMLDQDPIDAELTALEQRSGPLQAEATALKAEMGTQIHEIEAALSEETQARAAAAAHLPTALSDRYETLRAHLKGTGAARLIRNRCDGCHLELSSVEVEHIRRLPPGQVATCEQCGRLLVPV